MTSPEFTPVIYVRKGCPFCFRLRLFLLEAGLLDRVRFVDATNAEAQPVLHANGNHGSVPLAEIAPGRYLGGSDQLVTHFATLGRVDPSRLPTYQDYLGGVYTSLQHLFRENMTLKARLR